MLSLYRLFNISTSINLYNNQGGLFEVIRGDYVK